MRLVLDVCPEEVITRVRDALLRGKPGTLPVDFADLYGDGGIRNDDVYCDGVRELPMPFPVSPEWLEFAGNRTRQLEPTKVFQGGRWADSLNVTGSLGLRPLRIGEQIQECSQEGDFVVTLQKGCSSHIVSTGQHDAMEESGSTWHFFIKSRLVDQENVAKDINGDMWVTYSCVVRSVCGGRRTELVRQILSGGAIEEASRDMADESWITGTLRVATMMLEFETRAWAACHGFPLVEVWRGVRIPWVWAVKATKNCVAAYNLCSGHAGCAASEVWPLFDDSHAQRLTSLLPRRRPCGFTGAERQFAEGDVSVESFAAVLDRVCRRAAPEADIFRKFVDLGSGPGHAVLTAHALMPFRACVGVELAPGVVAAAREFARRYVDEGLAAKARSAGEAAQLFVEGDLLDLDWSDASVVFAHCVTWPDELVRRVAQRARELRPGAVFLSAQSFPDDPDTFKAFDFRGEACLASWTDGSVHLWAYQRI